MLRVVAQGLMPLYPVMLTGVDISKLWMGYFMAGMYLASFLGNWCSGFLLDNGVAPQKQLSFSFLPIIAALIGMGMQSEYLPLFYYTALLSFFVGVNINVSTVIMGGLSDQASIMKNFAWMGLSNILATLFGGLLIGPFIHLFGNKLAFAFFAGLIGLSSLFGLGIRYQATAGTGKRTRAFKFRKDFLVLLISMFLLVMLIYFFRISLSLKMKEMGYNISQISVFATLGTLLVLPFPLLFPLLNKRYDAKRLLLSTHFASFLGFVLVYFFTHDVLLVLAISGVNYMSYCTRIPLMKIMHSLFDESDFAKAQSIYGSMVWLGAIAGYLMAGYLLEQTSFDTVFAIGGLLCVCSGIIFVLGQRTEQAEESLA